MQSCSFSNRPTAGATRPEFPPADSFEGRILRWLAAGQKVQAIKFYREETGAGLIESKEAVEALGRQYCLNVGGSNVATAADVPQR